MFSYLRGHRRSGSGSQTSPSVSNPASLKSPTGQFQNADPLSPRSFISNGSGSSAYASASPSMLPPVTKVMSLDEGVAYNGAAGSQILLDGYGRKDRSTDSLLSPKSLVGTAYSGFSPHSDAPWHGGRREPGVKVEEIRNLAHALHEPGMREDSVKVQGGGGVVHAAPVWTFPSSRPQPDPWPSGTAQEKPLASTKPLSYTTPQMPPKSGKGKRTLLKPMTLLSRRRAGHSAESSSDDLGQSAFGLSDPKLADDFDPSIRGKGVHDFSAPRARRDFSNVHRYPKHQGEEARPGPGLRAGLVSDSRQEEPDSTPSGMSNSGHRSSDGAHTPVFFENFEDDIGDRSYEAAARAEALANKEFLSRAFEPVSANAHLRNSSLTRDLPPLPTEPAIVRETEPEAHQEPYSDNFEGNHSSMASRASTDGSDVKHVTLQSRTASIIDMTSQLSPARLASQASRFSFQIAGVDSAAQEKLLEERHKQKEAAKANAASDYAPQDDFDDYQDDYDYGEGYEEDGFEERIPGVNADADSEAASVRHLSQNFAAFNFTSASPEVTNGSDSINITPIDNNGNVIGSAISSYPIQPRTQMFSVPNGEVVQAPSEVSGLGLTGLTQLRDSRSSEVIVSPTNKSEMLVHPKPMATEGDGGDDLYFDDGLIQYPEDTDGVAFDESIFDDPESPFYGRKVSDFSLPPASSDTTARPSVSRTVIGDDGSSNRTSFRAKSLNLSLKIPSHEDLSDRPGAANGRSKSWELSQANITAYHSALAEAANKAAADGKFSRHDSIYADQAEPMEPNSTVKRFATQAQPVRENGQGTEDSVTSPIDFQPDISDSYGYDDEDYEAIDDDPMVAAANAEALANDFEGVYGQEFGFYAQALGKEDIEFANGGYFGPRGVDPLGRSMSGRNAVREPNLTPITERSEYSTRNSYISLAQLGAPFANGMQPQPSPGLVQLVRLSPFGFDDDEMSFSHLRKLRRGAFGGSNGSLRSTSSSPVLPPSAIGASALSQARGPSPIAMFAVSPLNGPTESELSSPVTNHNGNSALASGSVSEFEDETISPISATGSAGQGLDSAKGKLTRRDAGGGRKTHSRTGSAADSVTYIKEQDAAGEDRWVLERRRTAESGELELVGREIVEGGRI